MANTLTQEFPLPKDTYITFDAISLRNLIIQRLNDQGIFTDQNYIGSNLASIIDIISYSFNTLMFYLNKTSSESMFTEAQLFENINRIVKLLDYKPIGYQTSTLAFQISAILQDSTLPNFTNGIYTIPRYSYVTLRGITYSFNEDISFAIGSEQALFDNVENQTVQPLTDVSNKKLLLQGTFREYPIYQAAGNQSEVVVLNVVGSLVDHFNIHAYVYEERINKWIQYKEVPNFYGEDANSRVFEKRLNPQSFYELTFGDGINGRKLEPGDKVAIYFLQSDGENGVIAPGELATGNPLTNIYSSAQLNEILQSINETEVVPYLTRYQINKFVYQNESGSTIPKDREDIDSIRKNAPSNFKGQYRLVTQRDYETYIKTNFSNLTVDVKTFSNWDYTGKYLRYFYNLGLSPQGFNQILLNQVNYSDACNFNNVYVCAIPRVSVGSTLKYLLPSQKELIVSNLNDLKTLTTEVTFMDPIYKAVSLGVSTSNDPTAFSVDENINSYLYVEKAKTSSRPNTVIIQEIAAVFKSFFNPINLKIGGSFDYTKLVGDILTVEGVVNIFTGREDVGVFREGVSLFMWNPVYPVADKKIVTSNVTMNEFEVFYFEGLGNIDSKIRMFDL